MHAKAGYFAIRLLFESLTSMFFDSSFVSKTFALISVYWLVLPFPPLGGIEFWVCRVSNLLRGQFLQRPSLDFLKPTWRFFSSFNIADCFVQFKVKRRSMQKLYCHLFPSIAADCLFVYSNLFFKKRFSYKTTPSIF